MHVCRNQCNSKDEIELEKTKTYFQKNVKKGEKTNSP